MTLREAMEQANAECGIPRETVEVATKFADAMWPGAVPLSHRKIKDGCETLVIELFKHEPEGFIEMAMSLTEGNQ